MGARRGSVAVLQGVRDVGSGQGGEDERLQDVDEELEQEAWFVGQLAPDELWLADSTLLWSTTLSRKGGPYALLARMPDDPSVN